MLMKLSNRVRSVSLQRLQMATVEVHAPSSNSSSQKDCKELNSQGIKMSCANKKKWPIPTSHTSQNIAKELPSKSQNFSVPSCSLRSKVLQARDSQFNSSCLPGLEERLFLICLAEGIWLRRSDFLGFLGCSGCSSGTYSKISLPRSTYSWNVQIWPSRIPTVWAGDHVCLCKVAKYVQIAASHAQPALHACCPSGSWSLASQPDRVWKWSAFSLTFPDFSLRKPDLPKKKPSRHDKWGIVLKDKIGRLARWKMLRAQRIAPAVGGVLLEIGGFSWHWKLCVFSDSLGGTNQNFQFIMILPIRIIKI